MVCKYGSREIPGDSWHVSSREKGKHSIISNKTQRKWKEANPKDEVNQQVKRRVSLWQVCCH